MLAKAGASTAEDTFHPINQLYLKYITNYTSKPNRTNKLHNIIEAQNPQNSNKTKGYTLLKRR